MAEAAILNFKTNLAMQMLPIFLLSFDPTMAEAAFFNTLAFPIFLLIPPKKKGGCSFSMQLSMSWLIDNWLNFGTFFFFFSLFKVIILFQVFHIVWNGSDECVLHTTFYVSIKVFLNIVWPIVKSNLFFLDLVLNKRARPKSYHVLQPRYLSQESY